MSLRFPLRSVFATRNRRRLLGREQLEAREVLAYLVPVLEAVNSVATGEVTYQQTNDPYWGDTDVYHWTSSHANEDVSDVTGFKYHYSSWTERDTWEVYSPGGVNVGGRVTLSPDEASSGQYDGGSFAIAQLKHTFAHVRTGGGSTTQAMSVRFLVVADENDVPGAPVTVSVEGIGRRYGSGTAGYSISGPISHSHSFTINSDYLVTRDSRSFAVLPGDEFTVSWNATAETSGGKDHTYVDASVSVTVKVLAPDIYTGWLEWDVAADGEGGVEFSYGVANAPLPSWTTVALYWAENDTAESIIGAALHTISLSAGYDSHDTAYVSAAQLGEPPANARYLLGVADRAKRIPELTELNNVVALSLLPDVAVKSAEWSEDQQAMEFSYQVMLPKLISSPTELPDEITIEVFWADDASADALVGNRIHQQLVQRTDGSYGPYRVAIDSSRFPVGATHLIVIADRENDLAEADEENNVFVLPLPDLEPDYLHWNEDRAFDPGMRGLDFAYQVQDADATSNIKVGFYWADGPNYGSRIGDPVMVRTMEDAGYEAYHGLFNEPARWGQPPVGATHILMVVDPFNEVIESNEYNNVMVLRLHSASEVLSGAITYDIYGHYLHVSFRPGQGEISMSEAEVALGVDHFNWEQQIVEIPEHWDLVHAPLGGSTSNLVSLPVFDPATFVSNANELVIVDTDLGEAERFGGLEVDSYPYYYHEPDEIHQYIQNEYLNFDDSPRFPARFLQPGDYVKFRLRLVGVSYTTTTISLPGVKPVEWKTNSVYDDNQTLVDGGIFMRVTDDMEAPDVIAGGVYDLVEVDVIGSPPVAEAVTVTTPEDTSVHIALIARDEDGEELTYVIFSPPAFGTLSGSAPNLIYTPLANYFGPDSFSYRVHAGGDESNVAVVSLTVTAVSEPATNIELKRKVVFSNLPGAWVGQVSVSDPDPGGHVIRVDDARFEVRDGHLYLKSNQSAAASPASFTISITATDADAPTVSLTRTFTLTVEAPPTSWPRAYQWAPWAVDVNADGLITPLDALLVIIEINHSGLRDLPSHPGGTLAPLFFDVSGDGMLNPLDAALVINYLNAHGSGEGGMSSTESRGTILHTSQANDAHAAWLWDDWFREENDGVEEWWEV